MTTGTRTYLSRLRPRGRWLRGGTDGVAIVTIGVVVFGLRWLTLDFDNDDFMHVAWAAEMLRGHWPVRDFVEPGLILQTSLSYLALRFGGYQLVGEGLIACAFIAFSAVLSYTVSRRLGMPRWLAVLGAVVAAAMFPRIYAYPKAFIYPAAVLAALAYVQRPSNFSLGALAGVTAAAFLFRPDHGMHVALYVGLTLLVRHRTSVKELRTAAVAYACASAMLIAPWTAWVVSSGHGREYWAFLTGHLDGAAPTIYLPDRPLHLDFSAPLVALAPIDDPHVKVRWAQATPPDVRAGLESRYGLRRDSHPSEGQTIAYRLGRADRRTIAELISNPAVEDTQGIDRSRLLAPAGLFPWLHLQAQRYVPLVRLRVLPGLIQSSNATAWLNAMFFAVPLALVAMELVKLLTRRQAAIQRHGSGQALRVPSGQAGPEVLVPIALLAAMIYQRLVRGSPDSRLGDVAPLQAVLLCWSVFLLWNSRGKISFALKPLSIAVLALTVGSAVAHGGFPRRLAAAGVDGPTNIVRRAIAVTARFAERPLDVFAPTGSAGLPFLERWLNQCTPETARVALIGFEPQVHVVSERSFAGGRSFYALAWNNTSRDQQLVIKRWSQQDVPVVLAMESEWSAFVRDYPSIHAWLDARYRQWNISTFGGKKSVRLFFDKSLEIGETPGALPCLSPQPHMSARARGLRRDRS